MLKMALLDESDRAYATIELLFGQEFEIRCVSLEALEKSAESGRSLPDVAIYLSVNCVQTTASRMERIREKWPRALTVLLLPRVSGEKQLGKTVVPAHKIIYSPCSKQHLVRAVESFSAMLHDSHELQQDWFMLTSLLEFIGADAPLVYVAYNRISPLILSLCNKLGYDAKPVSKTFVYYLLTLSSLDEATLAAALSGSDKKTKTLNAIHTHVERMADLLKLDESTEYFSSKLRYIHKRFDGAGLPKNEVEGTDIPASCRIIRLLMDHHRLLQQGKTVGESLFILNSREGWYDPAVVRAFIDVMAEAGNGCIRSVYPLGLAAGMEIAEDVYGMIDGKRRKFLARGEILTEKNVEFIQRQCDDVLDITEPIKIAEPLLTR